MVGYAKPVVVSHGV